MAEVNGPEYYTQLAKDMRAMADFIESKADTLPPPFFEGTKVTLDFWQRDKRVSSRLLVRLVRPTRTTLTSLLNSSRSSAPG
jgi:hypothetical protein